MNYSMDLDDLVLVFNTQKGHLVEFLKKHFVHGKHYTVIKRSQIKKHGGHNKIDYKLTEETYDLIKSTYNIRRRKDMTMTNTIVMCVEDSSIGFICECLNGITTTKREYSVSGMYRLDLYLPEKKLAIECDELDHKHYDKVDEQVRENFIRTRLGCEFIRFNPTSEGFSLSKLLNSILSRITK